MPWNSPPTRSSGYTITATSDWNPVVQSLAFLEEVAYTAFTSNVSITSTSEAAPNDVVSSGAITYEAVPHLIEFSCTAIAVPASATVTVSLWDGSTDLGRLIRNINAATGGGSQFTGFGVHRLTPTAASHTYRIRVSTTSGTGTIVAGAGGAGVSLPGYIRIVRVPT